MGCDVPWLFADPDAARADWRNRWQLALAELENQADTTFAAARRTDSETVRSRLTHLGDGQREHLGAVRALLEHLDLAKPAALNTYLALKTRLPPETGLFSYAANVFRDWCWGDQENAASVQAVTSALGDLQPERVLVLGAGAGRLAYDLHQQLEPALTVALDVNPYLTTLLRRLSRGESLELTEFPRAPVDGRAAAIRRKLTAPCPARDGFEVLLADALRAPFRPGSFDLVLTPWLLDVINVPAEEVLPQVNQLLCDGGRWLLHGSLAFEHPDPTFRHDLAELIEVARSAGFDNCRASEVLMPYLTCPDSRHGRQETVVTMVAQKVAQLESPPRHQALPDWIARGREPVPLLPGFQTQAMTVRMHAFLMTLIDGKRSIRDMATLLEQQQLMPKADAEQALRGFLIKMYDEAAKRGP